MIETFSTRNLEAREKLDYWNSLIGQTWSGLVVDSLNPHFDARLSRWQMAELAMARPTSAAAVVSRRVGPQSLPPGQKIIVHIVNSGECRLQQRGREVILREGDMTICAGEDYYRFDIETRHEILIVEMDRECLAARRSDIDDHVARCISGRSVGTRMVHRYVQALWEEARSSEGAGAAATYSSVLADLIAASLDASTATGAVAPDPLFRRACEFIDACLCEPELSPSLIATALNVPLRTLQAAAARAETTLGATITARRLQLAARRLRQNPLETITAIAFDCGFADSAYFARRFQQQFGLSPSQYRSRH